MSPSAARFELLTVAIPVYNERGTWRELLGRVEAVELPLARQVVLVDDGSTDGTREELRLLGDEPPPRDARGRMPRKVILHEHNRGKGAALRTAFEAADGDIVLIQDADLEYDPQDYPALLAPILEGRADVVYGSRFAAGRPAGTRRTNYLANRFLTRLSNLATGLKLTDMETCFKVFRRDVLRRVRLREDRFGIEPELTARVARLGARVCEVPIRYRGRTRAEGKKIGWKDGLRAIACIVRYGRRGPSGK